MVEGYKDFKQDEWGGAVSHNESSDRLILNTSFARDTFVVLRRNWYPEWFVEIDGKSTPSYQANLIHVGVLVPKGNHKVILSYKPIFFYQGIIIALGYISFIVLLKFFKRGF